MKELETLNAVVTDDLLSEMEMLHICGGVNPSNPDDNTYCYGANCTNCYDGCGSGTCNSGTCNSGTCNSGTCNSGTCNSGTCNSGIGSGNSGNGSGNVGNNIYMMGNCKGH